MSDIPRRPGEVLKSRKLVNDGDPEKNYIARLFNKGDDIILKEIGKEVTETIMAARDARAVGMTAEARNKIVYEIAGLWFYVMVLLSHFDLTSDDMVGELVHREGLSDPEEKALRKSRACSVMGD